jgi:hypothetical protein
MSAPIYSGTLLGDVPRWYEDRNKIAKAGGKNYLPKPLHRHDDHSVYMRPDAAGTMEVLAECERHFVRQPQRDLLAGMPAACSACG